MHKVKCLEVVGLRTRNSRLVGMDDLQPGSMISFISYKSLAARVYTSFLFYVCPPKLANVLQMFHFTYNQYVSK